VDGWATARALLHWRDHLVAAGWTPEHAWSGRRLADIAAAERAAEGVPDGIADRLVRVTSELDDRVSRFIRRVRLIDRRAVHPVGWRRLIGGLERRGIRIEEIHATPSAPEGTALGRLQRWIIGAGACEGRPDGSFTIATSRSSVLAAELVGQWFAAAPPDRSTALIAQGGDTQLLDHGLRGSGQPRAGRSLRSPHRGSLQLLLLAFKVAWRPFDAHALMELLLFPRSPIAARAASRLAAALAKAPGRGGEAWLAAWEAIEADEMAAAVNNKDRAKALERLGRWRAWAEPGLSDLIEGIASGDALAVCDRTISWAVARHAVDDDPLYLATATLAEDVRRALVALQRAHYPRNLIERMIDQALEEGHDNPAAAPEASFWRCVAHPGAVWAPMDSIVWWNFTATEGNAARAPWTAAERAELAARDCEPDDSALEANAMSAAWERAVLSARQRLLLFAAGANSDDALHPFAHRIAPALDMLADRVRMEDALAVSAVNIAGTTLGRVAVEPGELPLPRAAWTTPPGFAERVVSSSESATSLERLLSCHLMWALRHVAHLHPGRAASIPDGNRLLGNLAHALAREIFPSGHPTAPEDAAYRTHALLDLFIDQIAAPLRFPAQATELAFARGRLPDAMAALSRTLTANGLEVEATEQQVGASFQNGPTVSGAIDLVTRDVSGDPVIIDLKWTRKARERVEELKSGRAVQLATYGAMLAENRPYRAGYFLLHQRQFATLRSDGLRGQQIEGVRSLPETWAAILGAWGQWKDKADGGMILALGVESVTEHVPPGLQIVREVRCDRCDYSTICRVRGKP
jgi:RecB family exonuclease